MDKQKSKEYVQGSDFVEVRSGKFHLYYCSHCDFFITSTYVPMEPAGVAEKLRGHTCASRETKRDFEREIN